MWAAFTKDLAKFIKYISCCLNYVWCLFITWIVSLWCTKILLCCFFIFLKLGKKTQWYFLSLLDGWTINLGITFVPNLSELHVLKISFTCFLVNLYTVTFRINFPYSHEGPRILLTSFKNCLWIEFCWLNLSNFV